MPAPDQPTGLPAGEDHLQRTIDGLVELLLIYARRAFEAEAKLDARGGQAGG